MISPTVGRIVWFYKYSEGQGHKGPLAAIVVEVHSDTNVNLTVFDNHGVPRAETSVYLAQPESEVPQADYCQWMPYHVVRAARLTGTITRTPLLPMKKSTGSESGEKDSGTQTI